MNKQKIPKLRFPGFTGEWQEKRLGELYTFKNGINANKEQYGSGYKFINVLDIIRNHVIKHEDIIGSVDVTEEIFEKNKVEYGDILFQRSSETREEAGQSNVYLDKDHFATFGGFVIRGRMIQKNLPLFMHYLFKTEHAKEEITTKSNGSTHFNVGQETLSKVKIAIPTLLEQKRIADFLSDINTKIEKLTSKKELTEQYKKGAMQKIFSQKIHFKDDNGKKYPNWEEKRLGDVFDHRSERGDESFELLSVTMNEGVKRRTDIEGKDNSNPDKSNYKIVCKNDIVYNSMRMWQGASGVSPYKGIVSPAYTVLSPRINADSVFFGYFFKTEPVINIFQNNSQGLTSDTWNLKYPQLSKIKFKIPCVSEQKKIAEFLMDFDKKIEHIDRELARLNEFKKGLLQGMFV